MTADEDILTISDLSVHLKVHPTTIYRLLRQGCLPGFRVGNAWRFSRGAIAKWEEKQVAGLNSSAAPSAKGRKKGRKARK